MDILRCGGIYGDFKYNSTFHAVLAGTARRIVKPGHSFPRVHIDDVAAMTVAAADQARPGGGVRVLHAVDDSVCVPAAEVVAYAAELLGRPAPEEVAWEAAWETMTPLAKSFWGEDVKVLRVPSPLFPPFRSPQAPTALARRAEDDESSKRLTSAQAQPEVDLGPGPAGG